MSDRVRFVLNGETVEWTGDPTRTLLDWLRYERGLTGSKEGCCEGDCGACTVLLREGDQWRAVNACILFLPMLDGRAVLTVEGVGTPDTPSPVQQKMVDCDGSQCGFCTPGFVMSLHGRAIGASGCDLQVEDAIAGNLCRCTGYGPILEAGTSVEPQPAPQWPGLAPRTAALDLEHGGRRWLSPRSLDELAELYEANPQARIVAGATDVGLWVTKQHRQLDTIIWLGEVEELGKIEEKSDRLTLGAGVRYADAHAALGRLHPDLYELVRRIGALQVRNSGTIGGNIANASPIGDMPPALIALGARLTLRRGYERRMIPLEDYFLAYGKQDRRPGEFVESVYVLRPKPDDIVRIVKLSKRFDSDITAALMAVRLGVTEGRITSASVAFGGMAGTPKRAPSVEAALIGPLSPETFEAAALAVAKDFKPLSDLRGSSAYRLEAAANLLRRLWVEQSGGAVSVLGMEAIRA